MARILIAEDDRNSADTISQHLQSAGHSCALERTGEDVLRQVRESEFDLLILDVMLPKISGFEVCRRIRQDSSLYTLPILVVSAMNSEEEIMHGLAQGADDYVGKPYNIQNLVQRAEGLLRSRGSSQAADPMTGLPGADHTKREIQKRICARQPFGVAYVELPGLRTFAYRAGSDKRDEAIRLLGETLSSHSREAETPEAFVGHMGGGHFVCLAAPEHAAAFCQGAYKKWSEDGASLFRHDAGGQSPQGGSQSQNLDAMFCITFRDANDVITPQQLFEVLSQIRNKGQATHPAGIYMDQRTITRA